MTHILPSLDDGFRHPCRNDGSPTLMYNGERSGVGTIQARSGGMAFLLVTKLLLENGILEVPTSINGYN